MNHIKSHRQFPPELSLRLNSPALALVLLFALLAFFLILLPIVSGLLARAIPTPQGAMRIAMVMQDVFVFVLPAVVAAVASTRLPARLLAVEKKPHTSTLALALTAMICSIPAMNAVITWNESLHLPASLAQLEQTMRSMEEAAKATTDLLMAGASVWSMLVSVLIVGCLAGFSEEIFFRGAFQRILQTTKTNGHVAVWIGAVVFSLFHFQMFGFVPRMLLGAFFGYLLWWSGSLWLPVIAHAFNNTLYVVSAWSEANYPNKALQTLNDSGAAFPADGHQWIIVVCSVVFTAVLLRAIYLNCRRRASHTTPTHAG